ncbi:hypothetical protein SH661x_001974 [Planctomicrobium sp. SH661]|uniref:hypothetical protein n=1 Tax=Planctomicrobium sp. SH661 TaxID=3448124 RepID=UPI003F5BF30D
MMRMLKRWMTGVALLCGFHFCQPVVSAAETLMEKWTAGVEEYKETREKLTAGLEKLFDVAEAKAKGSANTPLQSQVQRERTDFSTQRILPRHVNSSAYTRGMTQAAFKLRQLATKTKAALQKEGLTADAAKVDLELEQALGPLPPRTPAVVSNDPRTFWASEGELAHFRLLTDGTWHECGPGGDGGQIWVEIGRSATAIDLMDENRHFAMRLQKDKASVDYEYSGKSQPRLAIWKRGRWLSTAEANAIIDEEAARLGVGTPVVK